MYICAYIEVTLSNTIYVCRISLHFLYISLTDILYMWNRFFALEAHRIHANFTPIYIITFRVYFLNLHVVTNSSTIMYVNFNIW